jgi:hypothetical protein
MKIVLATTMVAVVLAAPGCGSSGTPAAQAACARMWYGPGDATLTRQKMVRAAGQPNTIEPQGARDIYGKPLGYKTWRWGHTTVVFARDGKAVLAICGH